MKTTREADKQPDRSRIVKEIKKMTDDANRLIESKNVSFAELQILADGVAEIRWLLGEWANTENKLISSRPTAEEIRVLKERALELEGRVKEVRNGLAREPRLARAESEKL